MCLHMMVEDVWQNYDNYSIQSKAVEKLSILDKTTTTSATSKEKITKAPSKKKLKKD